MEGLTTDQIIDKYKVSRSTVARWRKEGMPYHKINSKTVRYDEAEVEKWFEKRDEEYKKDIGS